MLIKLSTKINAPIERCFDLSTSIDLHKSSAAATQEEAIEGTTSGLIKLNETVTWRAKHFGIWHHLTVKITKYEKPNCFVDEMIKGSFKVMKHKHEFQQIKNGTLMLDTFQFASPFGILGKVVDLFILKKYLKSFLIKRNKMIQDYAESDMWKEVLAPN